MRIKFLGIVNKFPKIPLREVVAGDRRLRQWRVASGGGRGRPAVATVVGGDLWRVALGDDRGILILLQWQTFPSHGNVGFPWGRC